MDRPKQTRNRTFRLLKGETVSHGMRRIACGRLLDANETLSGASEETLGEAVHETRKALKRLRTSVRLTRDALGEQPYARENTLFRAAGQDLAAGRDAQVRLDTLDDLSERYGDELPERAIAELRARLEEEHARALQDLRGERLDRALSVLRGAQLRAPRWTFDRDGFDVLAPGLRRIYGRGRKRMRAAAKDPTAEHLHDWRKRVKDLWHVAQILEVAQPKRMRKVAKRAHKLSGLLGDHHDLSVLRAYVEQHPAFLEGPEPKALLLEAIDRRSSELCDKALRRGRKLYARSPKRFVREIESGWRKRAAGRPRA